MEFWGAEVKVGEAVKVDPTEFEACLHLSQVALGEAKKDKPNEPVLVYLKVGNQKFVLGTLTREKFPQIALDLILEKEFEISHNSKSASVHFCGYKSFFPDDEEDDLSDDSDEEDLPLQITENGIAEAKTDAAKASQSKKPDTKAAAPPAKQVKVVEPKKDAEEGSDNDSDEDDDSGSDDEMEDADSESDEEDESDEDEEDTPPKKVDQGKKRPNDSAPKTPVSNKKAKNATPEKTDGKKGGHIATPHPLKKTGKTQGSETPKSGGNFSCKSCSKSFNSESGFQQHNKAKHGQ